MKKFFKKFHNKIFIRFFNLKTVEKRLLDKKALEIMDKNHKKWIEGKKIKRTKKKVDKIQFEKELKSNN